MHSLPANIYSVAAVREIDRIAIEESGIPGYTLMKRAGAAAINAAQIRFPHASRWQVICGAGNNAGDGYVVARFAAREGIDVSVVALVDPARLSGDAATAYKEFAEAGGAVLPWTGTLDTTADLLVDAILGSGLERNIAGEFADAVAAVNAHPAPVHAMDIPTGIHGDTGAVMGSAVVADLTTTFVGLKAGLFLGDGPEYCGEIGFSDLSISDECRAKLEPQYQRITDSLLARTLMPRSRSAHKGNFGHVLVVGGGPGMSGAARLCAEAALRAGAGRVSLATHPDHAALISAARPELMSHGIADAADLKSLLDKADVVAFGPGLGQSGWARELFAVVAASDQAAVWDADALNLLAMAPDARENRVITPHPGEAATLLETDSAAIQSNRPAALKALAETYGGVVVLKGAGSLVSAECGAPFLSTSGNPGMAAAGMGDVLTGVIAALIGQGLSLRDAAAAGVEIHARAGDIAATAGERGMLASDLIAALQSVVNP